jgi:hypothetical protein
MSLKVLSGEAPSSRQRSNPLEPPSGGGQGERPAFGSAVRRARVSPSSDLLGSAGLAADGLRG